MDTTPPTSTVNTLPTADDLDELHRLGQRSTTRPGRRQPALGRRLLRHLHRRPTAEPSHFWTTVTPANPSATFTGQAGHTYGFYSVATDNAGNVQPTPTAAQATTQVVTQQPTILSAVSGSGVFAGSLTLTATLASNGTPVPDGPVSFAMTVGGVSATFGPATTGANGVATLTVALPAGLDAGTFTGAIAASFAGDQNYQSAAGTGDLANHQGPGDARP